MGPPVYPPIPIVQTEVRELRPALPPDEVVGILQRPEYGAAAAAPQPHPAAR